MYDQSLSFTVPSGACFLGIPEGSRFCGSLGTTSASAGEPDGGGMGATRDGGFQNLARETPGNGAPDPTPATSTMVAARSRRLTGSLTTRFAVPRPGGITTSGTCSSVS